MKKKLFFTFACAMALIAGFVSCTNDDFEELAPVAEMQKSAMTRSASGMTKEEVQARLDELSEKYGINVNMLYVRDYSEFTESTFEKIEQDIIAYKNRDINANAVTAQAGGNNLMDDCVIDEYEIADTFTWDDIVKDRNGEYLQVGHYSGGYSYHVCLKKQLKNNRRDLPAVAALGTNGLHFTDVISIVEPDSCHAEDHPCYTREGIEIAQEIIRESRALFGAFSSEGTMDFALKDLDYGLYVSFGDGFGKRVIPFGDCLVPFFELTYHGIILYNPISPTVNYPIKDARERLIYLLRGGKPSFYFYSKFRTGGMANWMGDRDLTANGEDDLRESVAFVAKAAKDYLPHADRQFIYMMNYEVLAGGIEVATYEDGSRIVGNFSEVDAEYDGHVVPAQDVLFL